MSGTSRTSSSSSCRPEGSATGAKSLNRSIVKRRITIRRGCGGHEGEQFHVRFCFPDATTADAFQGRFGGTRLTHSPPKPGRPSGPRLRYQRSYSPRVVDGRVMTAADLRRLHKYILEIEKVSGHLRRDARGGRKRVAGTYSQAAAEKAAVIGILHPHRPTRTRTVCAHSAKRLARWRQELSGTVARCLKLEQ
jgi:hypothetical protein